MKMSDHNVANHVRHTKWALAGILLVLAFITFVLVSQSKQLLTYQTSTTRAAGTEIGNEGTYTVAGGKTFMLECLGKNFTTLLSDQNKKVLISCLSNDSPGNPTTPPGNPTSPPNNPHPTSIIGDSSNTPSGSKACGTNPPKNPTESNPLPALTDPSIACAGYATPRVWLESQSWWIEDEPAPGPKCFPGDHIHVNTCFPLLQEVSGNLPLKVNTVLHSAHSSSEGPGQVNLFRIQVWDKADPFYKESLNWECPAGQNCMKTFNLNLDTTKLSTDGEGEFRMTANIKCNKSTHNTSCNRFYNTTRWFTIFKNGKSVKNYNHYDGSGAWYEGSGYTNIKVKRQDLLKLSYETLSGTVPITVTGEKDTMVVSVDSAAHGVEPGYIIYEGSAGTRTVNLNTRLLANGYHKFFIRACDDISKGTSCAVFVIAFKVQN